MNTIKINEYSRNPSGVLSNTIFDYFGLLITSNARWDAFTSLSIRNFSIRKGWGCSSEILNQTPKGDRSGRGLSFFRTPKRDHVKTQAFYIFLYFSRATLNETVTAKYDGVLPRMSRQKKKEETGEELNGSLDRSLLFWFVFEPQWFYSLLVPWLFWLISNFVSAYLLLRLTSSLLNQIQFSSKASAWNSYDSHKSLKVHGIHPKKCKFQWRGREVALSEVFIWISYKDNFKFITKYEYN